MVIIAITASLYYRHFRNREEIKIQSKDYFVKILIAGFIMLTIANIWNYLTETVLSDFSLVKGSLESFDQVNNEFSKNGLLPMVINVGIIGLSKKN